MSYILPIVILFVSGVVDLWMFYRLSHIQFNFNVRSVLAVISTIVAFFVGAVSATYGGYIASILTFISYYLIYRGEKKSIIVIGSIFFVFVLDLINEMTSAFISFFSRYVGVKYFDKYLILLVIVIEIFIVKLYGNKIYSLLISPYSKAFVYTLAYILLSIQGLLILLPLTSSITVFYTAVVILLIAQIVFAVIAYYELIHIQKSILDKQKQKKILIEKKQIEEYASYLEQSEDELRAFRHDYQNILSSLKTVAQEEGASNLVLKLAQYSKSNLNSRALLKYKDANHIKVKLLKGVIITKLTEMYNLNIPYNFECESEIVKLPNHIDEFDLVRIIGITIDNAIEESKAIISERKDTNSASIQIMIYSDGPNNFEYEIINKMRDRKISTQQIQERGFTTKKEHKGLGLTNINEISKKYPMMSTSYAILKDSFEFYLSIEE